MNVDQDRDSRPLTISAQLGADDSGGRLIDLSNSQPVMAPPQMNDDYHHIAKQCFMAGRPDLAMAAALIDIAESVRLLADIGPPDTPEQFAQRQAWLNRMDVRP
jgi:hypothetical protein